jgi:large subunit ribosomal protein L31
MKDKIHPQYYDDAVIKCSCGAVYKTGSTQKEMEIEICSACHPLYTGKKRIADTRGRVERFKKLTEKAEVRKETIIKAQKAKKEVKKAKVKTAKKEEKKKAKTKKE